VTNLDRSIVISYDKLLFNVGSKILWSLKFIQIAADSERIAQIIEHTDVFTRRTDDLRVGMNNKHHKDNYADRDQKE
jgi:hypothetical protein